MVWSCFPVRNSQDLPNRLQDAFGAGTNQVFACSLWRAVELCVVGRSGCLPDEKILIVARGEAEEDVQCSIENVIKYGFDTLHEGYTFLVTLHCTLISAEQHDMPANTLLETYLAHSVVYVFIADINT
jgi:hypothetical protein